MEKYKVVLFQELPHSQQKQLKWHPMDIEPNEQLVWNALWEETLCAKQIVDHMRNIRETQITTVLWCNCNTCSACPLFQRRWFQTSILPRFYLIT